MGKLFWGLIIFAVGLYAVYSVYKNYQKSHNIRVITVIVAVILLSWGWSDIHPGWQQVTHTGPYSAKAISESKAKARSKKESEEEDSAISSAQQHNESKSIDELNDKIAKEPELNGLHIKKAKGESDYEVTVPDEIANASDNEQKETYRHIFKLVQDYTHDGNATAWFYDSTGSELAHTTLSGDIKLK